MTKVICIIIIINCSNLQLIKPICNILIAKLYLIYNTGTYAKVHTQFEENWTLSWDNLGARCSCVTNASEGLQYRIECIVEIRLQF
jgi:hypothetical protein